jgi:cellulose synthase/poly-beta-1,6-N-acetylglucosamine synthase-like glycosyltransferase
MESLFWLSIAFVAYVYAGYPLLLAVWARAVAPRRRADAQRSGQHALAAARRTSLYGAEGLPGVTIIVAVRDEARRLPARIDNLLALDYPAALIDIIVASDGSADATAEALAPYARRVELLMLPAAGKANALNVAAARARHPILVFADARQRFAPDAIRRLVAHFDDPQIGAVSGELILDCEQSRHENHDVRADGGSADPTVTHPGANRDRPSPTSTIGDGVGAYWTYEKWLRRREAVVASTLGVTGAIYAMRRWLWQPLPADIILDDVLGPMRIVLRGYRVTFEPQARAFDLTARDAATEFRRKVRTLAGNFQVLAREPRLLVPVVNPVWLQFMSHKVGRLGVPYALGALLLSSGWLAPTSVFFALAFAGQMAFYGLAAYGAVLERRARVTLASAGEVIREAA